MAKPAGYSTLWTGALEEAANRAKAAAADMGSSLFAATVRAWAIPYLRHGMEETFAGPDDPKPGLTKVVASLADYLRASATCELTKISAPASERETKAAVENLTGAHYGNLFREFTAQSFAGEPRRLLGERLERNNVVIPDLASARVLDAGCGGGRYSVAWHLLGAAHVLGVDLSESGIADAKARALAMKLENVEFQFADVVELPLPDNSFDVVFSNGVLHHTRDWQRGIHNLLRVLKPGGTGWLYLIENPGGYFWDINELCREITAHDSHEHARSAVSSLGIPANRVFYMLDHAMVPINIRLTPEEVTQELTAAGAKGIRRLERGVDFDRVERIYQKDAFAVDKFGVGENRFIFTK